MKKSLRYYIGNTLILLSLIILTVIYLPFILTYLPQDTQMVQAQVEQGFSIYIPKINAYSEISENVDPWNKSEYMKSLEKGVAHARSTALPGQNGTIFLFAHSSLPPWKMTRVNTVFLRLGELQNGDKISLKKDGRVFEYEVFDKKEVDPSSVNYLIDNKNDQLILQTCSPVGTDWRRLLIFAKEL